MKAFNSFIGRFPFSGKFAIRSLFSIFLSSPDKKSRLTSYAILLGLLIFFVFGHGSQAWLGYKGMISHSPLWTKFIFLPYMVVNIAVTIVHTYLVFRATILLFTCRYGRRFHFLSTLPNSEMALALFVTLLGQALFIVPYLIYVS